MRRLVIATLVALVASVQCGGPDAGKNTTAAPDILPPAEAPEAHPAAVGDTLLASARASITQGAIDPELLAQITASDAPAHARARRLLLAMAQPLDAPLAAPAPVDGDAPVLRAPALPNAPVGPVEPVPAADPAAATDAAPKPLPSQVSPPSLPPASTHAAPMVSSLSLKRTKAGATLTIRGSGKLMVGVANQLASGRVYLVIDKAKATGAAAAARPKITGVAVTAVRKGQGTVQISLALDSGWSLGSRRSFPGGVRVHFLHTP